MKEIFKDIHLLRLGAVNAYLIDSGELTLMDCGYAGSWKKISGYLKKIGRSPSEIKNIVVTHLHSDHAGGLAEAKEATGGKVFMNRIDAELVQEGKGFREKIMVSPGLANKIVFRLFVKNAPRTITPVKTDEYIMENDVLPIGKGLKAIAAPGHCKGQLVFLYPDFGGLLFAVDTCGNLMGLNIAPFYEDLQQGYQDLKKISALEFEHAVFGHGNPLKGKASEKFRKKFKKFL